MDEASFKAFMAELEKARAFLAYRSYMRATADMEYIMEIIEEDRASFEEFV